MNEPGRVLHQALPPSVGAALPHESAQLHVAGRAAYTDDLPELAGTLHVALGLSPVAHGRLLGVDLDTSRTQPGVVDVFCAKDIPGATHWGPIVADDPLLATETLRYFGEPVFAVVATSRELARRAARLARDVIRCEPLPATLDPLEAHARADYVVPPMELARGDLATALAAAPVVLSGEYSVGGQEQFYLEGQISYAMPAEDGSMKVLCSTQHPTEMQHVVAHTLGIDAHRVSVECRRAGGGFGGKESQPAIFAAIAALAAQRLGRPVKLRPDRDDDMLITGRRHPFHYRWTAGCDAAGRVLALDLEMVADAGCSADLSAPVITRALCHVDNAYWLPHVRLRGYCARTNKQSNTAFRGFGGPQGALISEIILERVAARLGLDPLAVRRINLYGDAGHDTTPYGQPVGDNPLPAMLGELERSANYTARRAAIAEFNRSSPVFKRGIALTPVKFGIAFNLSLLNQAGALVHVYTDGSVLVNHGGIEMGQGLHTKIAQVVADELGVPLAQVRVTATDTSKVANTSATAASTGTDLNGQAACNAARTIRERIAKHLAGTAGCAPEAVMFADGVVSAGALNWSFAQAASAAYRARIQLWSDGFYATPGLHWDAATMRGHPCQYYVWGAAVSEVVIDTLTGESRLLRSDLIYDAGRSLNPALDRGQVEGGFIQGVGWLTTEELVMDKAGRLLTHAPSTYKIPTASDAPVVLNTRLFERPAAEDTLHRSKAVGEPPLLLAFSVLLALRDAVAAAGEPGCDPGLAAPATPEAVHRALQRVAPSA